MTAGWEGIVFFVTLTASMLNPVGILVIIDLDRPRRVLIKMSQPRLVELRHSMALDYYLPPTLITC